MIRLLLADDEDLIREALVTLLELEPDFKVVAQAGNHFLRRTMNRVGTFLGE